MKQFLFCIGGILFLLGNLFAQAPVLLNGLFVYQADIALLSPTTAYPSFNANSSIYKQVRFKAGEEITLSTGFEATSSSDTWFHAYLVPIMSYAELKETLDGSYAVTIENQLCFRYVEKYQPETLNYKVYNYKNEVVMSGSAYNGLTGNAIQEKPITMGSTFVKLDLENVANLVGASDHKAFYRLEVLNGKKDRFTLRFKYLPL